MQAFSYGSSLVNFRKIGGDVIDTSKRSDTHVSASSAGNYVTDVRSSTTTRHEIWIEEEDGTETAIQLSGSDVPLRRGHRVSILVASSEQGETDHVAAIINHTTRRWDLTINGAYARKQILDISLVVPGALVILSLLVGLNAFGRLDRDDGTIGAILVLFGGFVLPLGSIVYLAYKDKKRRTASQKLLDHIEQIAAQVLRGPVGSTTSALDADEREGIEREYRRLSKELNEFQKKPTWSWRPVFVCAILGVVTVSVLLVAAADTSEILSHQFDTVLMAVGLWATIGVIVGVSISGSLYLFRKRTRSKLRAKVQKFSKRLGKA